MVTVYMLCCNSSRIVPMVTVYLLCVVTAAEWFPGPRPRLQTPLQVCQVRKRPLDKLVCQVSVQPLPVVV